ncbi:hypothetical protein CAEBREN_24544 [Caenorhabditis brenneri]|uniref:Uncharacterized protein n=1 Tax=Caenorhabditis brenneri TaxID=135651 RepID=G0MC28_CAEBE|nr:hypothetical protein CAEBREN_24544 [Caenorhabditis brenneri]
MADEENPESLQPTAYDSPSAAEQQRQEPADMDIDEDERPTEHVQQEYVAEDVAEIPENSQNPPAISEEEAQEKSRIQKESFLEIFRIAPRVKDILPDLRIFMSHPDVIEWDRKEVEMLVEIRIQEEKAKKKAERAASKKNVEGGAEKPPVALADAIRSATGIDLAGILQKVPNLQPSSIPSNPAPGQLPMSGVPNFSGPPPSIAGPGAHFTGPPPPMGAPMGITPPTSQPGLPVITRVNPDDSSITSLGVPVSNDYVLPPNHTTKVPHIAVLVNKISQFLTIFPIFQNLCKTQIKSIGRGKAGFNTPHPNDIPAELRHAKTKPDLVAPIPDELRLQLGRPEEKVSVPAIPNELLPPEQRVYDNLPVVFLRPPMRKTLFLAGARFGKRADRIKKEEKKSGKSKNKKKKREEEATGEENEPTRANYRSNHPPPVKKPRQHPLTGMNALPAGLNKNSPLPVKRYHARQLAKDTGMSLEEAMAEIEEQCREFGGEDTPLAKEHDERAMEIIKKHGDEQWNKRYNYVPADHSAGIPGVDRPPSGLPPKKDREPPPARREDREPIPGVDMPPGGGARREPVPGIDRPPGGGLGFGFPAPEKKRARGGVKERERKKRREEFSMRGGGRGGGYDRYGGYDDRKRDYGRPYGEYDRQGRHGYNDYGGRYNDHRGGYGQDDHQGYDDYYGRQNAGSYDDYSNHYDSRYHQGGGEHGYDQYGAEGETSAETTEHYYTGAGGHEGHPPPSTSADTYYQEDGGQYYNHYYSTATEDATTSSGAAALPETSQPPPPLETTPTKMSAYLAKFGPGRAA